MTERNPNLDRHMQWVAEALTAAHARTDHAHAGVRVGVGSSQCGPVLGWHYDPEELPGYGWIEIRNFRGETVRKPLTDVYVHDVRPCWDRDYTPGSTTE